MIFLVFAGISVMLWLNQTRHTRKQILRHTEMTAEQIRIRVEGLMRARMASLKLLAERWVERMPPDYSRQRFLKFAEAIHHQYPGILGINWINPQGTVKWVFPEETNAIIKDRAFMQVKELIDDSAVEKADKNVEFTVTPCKGFHQGVGGFNILWPLVDADGIQGYLNGVFQVELIMETCLARNILANFWIRLFEDDRLIYFNGEPDEPPAAFERLAAVRQIVFPGKTWRLDIEPKSFIYKPNAMPDLTVLIFGIGISSVLSLLFYFLLQRMQMYRDAGDLAVLEVDERKRAQKALGKSMDELDERVKELNCFYSISRLVEKRSLPLEEILQSIVGVIPPAMQYPEIIGASIRIENQEYKTKGFNHFKQTEWKYTSRILVRETPFGVLEVFYFKKKPGCDGALFLTDEINLIDAIAERLGHIIERKQAEATVLKSEQSFRELVENSLTWLSIIQDNQVVYQNPEQEMLLGPLPREPIFLDFDRIHPDDVQKVKSFYRNMTSGTVKSLETDFRFYPLYKTDARMDIKWVICRASLIQYRGREAILVNSMDITTTKELEHLLRIQDKMSSLGRVTAGIAHEIRNPLSGINIYLNTLEKLYDRKEDPKQVSEIFNHLQSASAKIEAVIKRVMDFSKPGTPNFLMGSIKKPIEDAVSLSFVTMRKRGIKITKDLNETLPKCPLDHQLMEQVILNLMNNAAESMKNMDEEKIIAISCSLKDNRIIINVSDSGPGVPDKIKDKIFDPFYSTKNNSTGIGLSLCHRIISDHGGILRLSDSRLGGAEFTIELPVTRLDM